MMELVVSDKILVRGHLDILGNFCLCWLLVKPFLPSANMRCSSSVMYHSRGTREVVARDRLNYKYANYDPDYYHLS
jgi:hypothetical protein